jgi:hypothetical protein
LISVGIVSSLPLVVRSRLSLDFAQDSIVYLLEGCDVAGNSFVEQGANDRGFLFQHRGYQGGLGKPRLRGCASLSNLLAGLHRNVVLRWA